MSHGLRDGASVPFKENAAGTNQPEELVGALDHVEAKPERLIVWIWQAQYFGYVFRRCVALSVAGAGLGRPPMPFCVAGAAL